jgi:hypothetical protein
MGRTSLFRQFVLFVAGASLVTGLAIGFWPVSVTVVGDVAYSCGSGLVHSRNTWKIDSESMTQPQQTIGVSSTATPNASCPSRVYRHRDFAYALLGLAVGTYLVLLATAAYDPTITPTTTRRSKTRRVRVVPSR